MPYRQKLVQKSKSSYPGVSEDGFAELSEDELESIVGGKGAMAQDQIVEAEITALENNHQPAVTIINNDPSVNINKSQSGIGSIRKH